MSKTKKVKQSKFDKACDVFYSRLNEDGIRYTKFEADSSITPALEEFKEALESK